MFCHSSKSKKQTNKQKTNKQTKKKPKKRESAAKEIIKEAIMTLLYYNFQQEQKKSRVLYISVSVISLCVGFHKICTNGVATNCRYIQTENRQTDRHTQTYIHTHTDTYTHTHTT